MSQATQQPTLPEELASPNAKLVYLHIAVSGDASIRELQRSLGMSKLTLFAVLDSLQNAGIVTRSDGRYTCERRGGDRSRSDQ